MGEGGTECRCGGFVGIIGEPGVSEFVRWRSERSATDRPAK